MKTEGEMMKRWTDFWKECGTGCCGLWCGMVCAGLELVTIEKKPLDILVSLLCLKDCVSSDACQRYFGSSFDKYM